MKQYIKVIQLESLSTQKLEESVNVLWIDIVYTQLWS